MIEREQDIKEDKYDDAVAVSHENVKSVRFQSNVVQIQSYVDDEEITEGEEKRTRN